MSEGQALENRDLICKDCLGTTVDFLRAYIAEYKLGEEEKIVIEQKRSRPEDSIDVDVETKKIKDEEEKDEVVITCRYKKIKDVPLEPLKDLLLNTQWREYLCKCQECMEMYNKRKLEFIFTIEETPIHKLLEYQLEENKEEGKEELKEETKASPEGGIYDRLCELQLGALPANRQHAFISGYRKLIDSFSEYFKKHLEEGKVVTKDDIDDFFGKFNNNE